MISIPLCSYSDVIGYLPSLIKLSVHALPISDVSLNSVTSLLRHGGEAHDHIACCLIHVLPFTAPPRPSYQISHNVDGTLSVGTWHSEPNQQKSNSATFACHLLHIRTRTMVPWVRGDNHGERADDSWLGSYIHITWCVTRHVTRHVTCITRQSHMNGACSQLGGTPHSATCGSLCSM